MKDAILFLYVFIIGYICFMVVVVGFGRIFFPFLSKDELERRKKMNAGI